MAYKTNNKNKKNSGGTLTIVRVQGKEYARKGNQLIPFTSGKTQKKKKKSWI